MITGQQPFKGDYDKAVMYSIVAKCLSKRVGHRFQTAGDLVADLETFADRLSGTARPSLRKTNEGASREGGRPRPMPAGPWRQSSLWPSRRWPLCTLTRSRLIGR